MNVMNLHQQEKKCPICKSSANPSRLDGNSKIYRVNCSICGEFNATEIFLEDYSGYEFPKKYLIQGILQERNLKNLSTTLFSGNGSFKKTGGDFTIEELLKTVTQVENPSQKIDKLLENSEILLNHNAGENLCLSLTSSYPLAYSRSEKEFDFILKTMNQEGYFLSMGKNASNSSKYDIKLSLKAWKRIEELKKQNINSNQGFVACIFDPNHKQFLEAIREGIIQSKFDPMSIDREDYQETILEKGLGEIRKSRFVVADLTEESGSVFIEIGFAMGLGMQPILVIKEDYWEKRKGEEGKLEFYSQNYKILSYKDEQELSIKVETAIRARIESR